MNKNVKTKLGCAVFFCTIAFCGVSSAEVVQLSSEKAAQLAQKQSVAVLASELNVQAQEKSTQGTRASFFPSISGTGSYTHIFEKPSSGSSSVDTGLVNILTNPNADPADKTIINSLFSMLSGLTSALATPDDICSMGISIAQPLFTGGKLVNAYKLAKVNAEVQKANHQRTLTDIGFTAEKMYWGYVGMLKGLQSVRDARIWLEDLAAMQKKQFENQMIIELDLLNTKIQIDNFKLTELKTQNAIANYGDQMLLFLGLPTGSVIEVDTAELAEAIEEFVPPTQEMVNHQLDGRQDLKAMKSQIESLKLLKKVQTGSYMPTVAGFFSSSYSNQYSADDFELKRSTTGGLQLNWTIYDWGKTSCDIQKTNIQMKTLELSYNNTREQLHLKINSLVRAVDETRSALAIAQEDMETAKKALNISKIKYDAQAITNTDLLNSHNLLTNKVVAYTQARINAILALEEYKIAPKN